MSSLQAWNSFSERPVNCGKERVPISLLPGEFSPGLSLRNSLPACHRDVGAFASWDKDQLRWTPQLSGDVRTDLGEEAASLSVQAFRGRGVTLSPETLKGFSGMLLSPAGSSMVYLRLAFQGGLVLLLCWNSFTFCINTDNFLGWQIWY